MSKRTHEPGAVRVEVGVRELRAQLSHWIQEVQGGRSLLITDRGRPVARLVSVEEIPPGLQRMIADGRATLPPAPKEPAGRRSKARAKGSVSDLVREQRR